MHPGKPGVVCCSIDLLYAHLPQAVLLPKACLRVWEIPFPKMGAWLLIQHIRDGME
jgi:hypothetical protein